MFGAAWLGNGHSGKNFALKTGTETEFAASMRRRTTDLPRIVDLRLLTESLLSPLPRTVLMDICAMEVPRRPDIPVTKSSRTTLRLILPT